MLNLGIDSGVFCLRRFQHSLVHLTLLSWVTLMLRIRPGVRLGVIPRETL